MTKSLRYLFAGLLLTLGLPQAAAAQALGWAWAKTHGPTSYSTLGVHSSAGIGRDAAGNTYTAGGYTGTPTFGSQTTTNLGGSEAFLAKYDQETT